MTLDYLLAYIFLLPFLAFITARFIKFPNLREAVTILIAIGLFSFVLQLLLRFLNGGGELLAEKIKVFEIIPGLEISFSIEPISLIFLLVASFLWIVSVIYSIGYLRGNKEGNQGRFFSYFALSIFAVMGVATSANLVTLFLFYEILTLATFPLVAHSETKDAKKSAATYLAILLGTSVCFFLTAIILTNYFVGHTDFTEGGILSGKVSHGTVGILLLLFVYGVGKAALMPIHKWLPAAMVAPTPVSALLHAVAVVKAGVFTIVKIIIYIFGVDYLREVISLNWLYGGWLTVVAGFTIITASCIAIRQDSLKLRLAYSTISQLSYVIAAISLLNPFGIIAAIFHIVAHAVSKITLFFAAGAIYTASKKRNISEMNGIGHKMPITMIAFTIASLSMIGIPITVGFVTKFYLLTGVMQNADYITLSVVILSTVLNCFYFLPIVFNAFFKEVSPDLHNVKEAPIPIVIAISITAFLTIAIFFYPDLFLQLVKEIK